MTPRPLRVLMLGAGAIGGYYGARLLQAGHDVQFLVRPHRAALLAEHGLRLRSDNGDFHAPVPCLGSDDVAAAAQARPFDLVVLSCKAYDLQPAIAAIAPAVTEHTRVLPLLNGLRHLDALDAAFGVERVLGGIAHISVTLTADGAIRQFGRLDRLTFGGRTEGDARYPAIRAALLGLACETRAADAGILDAMWEKFVFLATLAGATCLLRGSVGEIVRAAPGRELLQRLYRECVDIAVHAGHAPTPQAQLEARGFLADPDSPLKASMLRDLERGAATEGEHILGDLLARGTGFGLDTPLLAAACCHLRVHEMQRAR